MHERSARKVTAWRLSLEFMVNVNIGKVVPLKTTNERESVV